MDDAFVAVGHVDLVVELELVAVHTAYPELVNRYFAVAVVVDVDVDNLGDSLSL